MPLPSSHSVPALQIRSHDFWRYIHLYVCMYVCMYVIPNLKPGADVREGMFGRHAIRRRWQAATLIAVSSTAIASTTDRFDRFIRFDLFPFHPTSFRLQVGFLTSFVSQQPFPLDFRKCTQTSCGKLYACHCVILQILYNYTSLFTVWVEKKHRRKHTTRKIEKKHKNTYLTSN